MSGRFTEEAVSVFKRFRIFGAVVIGILAIIAAAFLIRPGPQAQKEFARANEACRKDVVCSGKKFQITAEIRCSIAVEQLAKYDFRWTDTGYETKFDRVLWIREPYVIGYRGDKIQFQNGFGAWVRHNYLCEFDTSTEKATGVVASPGRLQ